MINLNCNSISTLSRDFNVRKQNVHLSVLDQIEPSAREEQTTIIGPILNGECRADDTRKILREERDTLQSSNEHCMAWHNPLGAEAQRKTSPFLGLKLLQLDP